MYLVHGGEYQRVVIIVAHNIAMAFLAGVALAFPVQKYKNAHMQILQSRLHHKFEKDIFSGFDVGEKNSSVRLNISRFAR